MILRYSLHEEYIEAELRVGAQRFDLGARAHHGLLLELARIRLEDRAKGVTGAEEGWVHLEDLSVHLGLRSSHVNVLVHRLRRQFSRLDVPVQVDLIQRRYRCGELRVGVPQLVLQPIAD